MAQEVVGSLFLPLVLLVLIELARVAREVDLVQMVHRDSHPFIFSDGPGLGVIPNLGRFTFIHTAIVVILAYSAYFVVTSLSANLINTTQATVNISLILIWLVWVLLPVLEVDEYDYTLESGQRPFSFYSNFLLATITLILTPIWVNVLDDATWAQALWTASLFLNIAVFLNLLGKELELVTDENK